MKKFLSIALFVIFAAALSLSAFAAEPGTVTITVTEADKKKTTGSAGGYD